MLGITISITNAIIQILNDSAPDAVNKKPRSRSLGVWNETSNSYWSACGDVVSELKVQVGFVPTMAMA